MGVLLYDLRSYFPKGALPVLSVLKRLLLLALLVAVLAGAWGAWWWQKPLTLRLPAGQKVLDLAVPAGSSGAAAAQAVPEGFVIREFLGNAQEPEIYPTAVSAAAGACACAAGFHHGS